MKKNYIIFFSLITLIGLFIYLTNNSNAIELDNPSSVINVEETGEADKGDYQLSVGEWRMDNVESGYYGRIILDVEDGYYVKSLTATYNDQELELGEETGQGFFRRWPFNPFKLEYQFEIPDGASSTNKVNVNVEYAKKAPITITYQNYEGTSYREGYLKDLNRYSAIENVLVVDYMDGDLVLTDDCMANGCLLKFQFANEDDYNEYKNYSMSEDIGWFSGSTIYRDREKNVDERVLFTDVEDCDDANYSCYVVVSKNFNKVSYGIIYVGYSKIGVFAPNSYSFNVNLDVENFSDILFETGSDAISFSSDSLEKNIELFYGTKNIYLEKKTVRPIINDNQENNCGDIGEFDDVEGEGYGYYVTYADDIATIHIDSYYQDKMILELDILNNNESVFDDSIKINLDRFAFSGNGGELLFTDEYGRNCNEQDNSNTCDEGRYYSTQYRGVISSFYVTEEEQEHSRNIGDIYRINNIEGNTAELFEDGGMGEEVYARNKDFTPHAIALFYDENDTVVMTSDFDLNNMVKNEGFVKKNTFMELYDGFNITPELVYDYVYMDWENITEIENIEYFERHLGGTIMYDLVLISEEDVEELGIKKIALFLVNGPMDEDNMPALTYGTGEGKVMEIRGED